MWSTAHHKVPLRPLPVAALSACLALLLLGSPTRADYANGLKAFKDSDYATAFAEWRRLAEAGDARSQHGLALLYETGQGVAVDAKAAARWYAAAVEQGLPAAQNNLGLLYADGRGVIRNTGKAIDLWHQAAASGYPMAQYNLGLAYFRGVGLTKNHREAVKWFTAAADRGVADAQYALAECYRTGRGVREDLDVARTWYAQAAQQGHAEAVARLSELFGVAATPGPVEAAPAGAGEAGVAPEEGSGFRVWLTSLQSEAAAESSWQALVSGYPDLLGRLRFSVRRVDLGADKGVWFRVLAGPFAGPIEADALCAQLRQRSPDENCVVVSD